MEGYIIWDNLYYYLLTHPEGHEGRYWLSKNPKIERLGDLLANAVEFFQNEAWSDKSDPPDNGPNGYGLAYTFPLYEPNKPAKNTWQGYGDREVWNLFAVAYAWTGEKRFFDRGKQCLAKVAVANGGAYWAQDQMGVLRLLWLMNHPKADATPPEAIKDLVAKDLGGGKVELIWTAPAKAAAYQIKFATRKFVDYLGYDKYTMQYKFDPKEYLPWPAGENVPDKPAPTPSAKQSYVVNGLKPGQKYYFAIRSWDANDNRSAMSNSPEAEVK
jgi:hypothetical protein